MALEPVAIAQRRRSQQRRPEREIRGVEDGGVEDGGVEDGGVEGPIGVARRDRAQERRQGGDPHPALQVIVERRDRRMERRHIGQLRSRRDSATSGDLEIQPSGRRRPVVQGGHEPPWRISRAVAIPDVGEPHLASPCPSAADGQPAASLATMSEAPLRVSRPSSPSRQADEPDSAALNAASTAMRSSSQAIIVDASWLIVIASPSVRNVPLYWLQPDDPLTEPSSPKIMVGADAGAGEAPPMDSTTHDVPSRPPPGASPPMEQALTARASKTAESVAVAERR
jgi:hypothetical protein